MHVIMWGFVVRPEKVREFISAYKADGAWAQLFSPAAGYGGTELLSAHDRFAKSGIPEAQQDSQSHPPLACAAQST